MPYKDKDKQRTYQRIWTRQKLDAIPKEFKFKPKTVTWEMLTGAESMVAKVTTYEECTKLSKDLLGVRVVNRVAVSLLALKACKIKRGGDMRSRQFTAVNNLTIVQFAADIGVNKKTLNNWINITQRVVMKLPEGTKEVDFHAAKMALDRCRSGSDEKLMEQYQALIDKDSPARDAEYFLRGVYGVNRTLGVGGAALVKSLTERELKAVEIMIGFIDLYFKDLKPVKQKYRATATPESSSRSRNNGLEYPSEAADELKRMALKYKNDIDIPGALKRFL